MKSITSQRTIKFGLFQLIAGISLVAFAIYLYFTNPNPDKISLALNCSLGTLFIGQAIYHLHQSRFKISWNEHQLMIKCPGRKLIVFTDTEIKNVTVTQNNLIINAGLGKGEMIPLKNFKEAERNRIQQKFSSV